MRVKPIPLFSPLRPGGSPAANGLHQVWKLLVLCLCMCMVGVCMVGVGTRQFACEPLEGLALKVDVGTGQFVYEPLEELALKDWRREDDSCTAGRNGKSVDYYQHYPLPHTHQRNECMCTPVHYFVILSMHRSGSGWFETLLNNHPNISSHGEIFSVKERRDNFPSIHRNLDVVFNLDWMNSAAKTECTAAVRFKWMLNQGPMEHNKEVLDYFERMGVSVILLLRRNVLKQLISILANAYDRRVKPMNGSHKSHVHSVEEALKLAEYKPTIDVKHLLKNLHRFEDMANGAQKHFKNTRMKIVYYEDLVTQSERLDEVLEFLGVPPRQLESQQVKIHTRPLREQIRNWNKVVARLKGTKYEALVKDDDYT